MVVDIHVQCINKPDRTNHYEPIQKIGGTHTSSRRWTLTEEEAILAIKQGEWGFYTMVNNVRAKVQVARHALLNREYLTTNPDNHLQNDLLHLPECRA